METITMSSYKFFHDPGHGWLQVSIKEINELGIRKQISEYSYRYGDHCYLEEDCDMRVFVEAYKKLKGSEPSIEDVYQENTPIRNYRRFK